MGAGAVLGGMVARSPRHWARLAGFCYLVNAVTSLSSFSGKLGGAVLTWTNWTATAAYVMVVILLYLLLRPVSRTLSAVAAVFGLLGCADTALWKYNLFPVHVHSLVFFGCYCAMLGLLILRSEFMPRFLGGLLLLAGAGWLTFVSVSLSKVCSPYNYIAGGVGEIPLMLWLLIAGVNGGRWRRQAGVVRFAGNPLPVPGNSSRLIP
jgi:hypothetical protein